MEEPGFNELIETLVQDLFQYFVDTFGGLGLGVSIIVLILVMIFQSIVAPIASEAVLASAGGILQSAFGTPGLYAALIGGIIGSLLGAWIAFYIARWIQRQFEERIVDEYADKEEEALTSRKDRFLHRFSLFLARFIDEDSEDFIEIIERRGFLIVLIGRLLVFVPFDAVSYAAGLTRIQFKDFMIATAIGTIPRVAFYVILGEQLAENLNENFTLFVILVVAFAIAIYGMYRFIMWYLRRQEIVTEEAEISPELSDKVFDDSDN